MRRSEFFILAVVSCAAWLGAAAQEPTLTEQDFKKLDTFEGASLAKADRVFASKDYRRAAAEYEAFLLQFPKSSATAYAILRKARSLHLDNKRREAVKVYTEVLDYFPNAVNYAGAALYYIGLCHWENGDEKEAMKAWAEMADDTDYRKHPLAAGAINQLADNLVRQGKADQAAEYYAQVASDFRRSNNEAAFYAIERAVAHYVRTNPNEPKLSALFEKTRGFDWHPKEPTPRHYWRDVRQAIRKHAQFQETEKDKRDACYRYWAGVMQGKFPEDDDFQIDLANLRLAYEGDAAGWMQRLDQQFEKYQKPGDYARVVKWIGLYGGHKAKLQEYYAKLDFAKMTNAEIQRLVQTLIDDAKDVPMARSAFAKLRLGSMPDSEKQSFAEYLWSRDEEMVEALDRSMSDVAYGQYHLLRYYHWRRNGAKGVALADDVVKVPQYAKSGYWMKAELLRWQGKHAEAIQAYQAADNPPDTIFRIAECLQALGRPDQAIAQLTEIENFFQNAAPEAAWRIARIHLSQKDRQQYVASLRGIMKKYPKSGQSSQAHQELEALGIKIGGGVDAE